MIIVDIIATTIATIMRVRMLPEFVLLDYFNSRQINYLRIVNNFQN